MVLLLFLSCVLIAESVNICKQNSYVQQRFTILLYLIEISQLSNILLSYYPLFMILLLLDTTIFMFRFLLGSCRIITTFLLFIVRSIIVLFKIRLHICIVQLIYSNIRIFNIFKFIFKFFETTEFLYDINYSCTFIPVFICYNSYY